MKQLLTKKNILIVVVAFLIIAQFFRIDKTNPTVEANKDYLQLTNTPAKVKKLISAACYDCHSYQTAYPWYTNVAPVSWYVKNHVNHGREHLNFSEWGNYTRNQQQHKMEESHEVTQSGEMPMFSYKLIHPTAWISKEERQLLISWFKQESERL